MKRMILHLLWLAVIITAIELLTLHWKENHQHQGWSQNYQEQEGTDSVMNREVHFSYVSVKEEEGSDHTCQ
jgi:hypothetical protein